MPAHHRNKYDFVVAAGIINNNYVDEKMLQQMLISVKNHGYSMFAARYIFMGDLWYTDYFKMFVRKGRIR